MLGHATAAALLACAWLAGGTAAAQTSSQGGAIFSCTTAAGHKLTSDRPLAECLDRDQRVLNKDGSLRTTLPPSLTSEERAALEESERRKQQEQATRLEAVRRDRNLLARYPNEAAHQRARDAALDAVRTGIKASEDRLADLQKQRKPLLDEAEFYKGRQVPAKLNIDLESIDVVLDAQRTLIDNQQAELIRVGALYDAELARLRRLWSGVEPGAGGGVPAAPAKPGMAEVSGRSRSAAAASTSSSN